MNRYHFFNTTLEINIKSEQKQVQQKIVADILEKAHSLQEKFNFYEPTSLLNTLNENKTINYDNDLYLIMDQSMQWQKLSNNYFNIDTTFCNEIKYEINSNNLSTTNPIDFGGIAKGYLLNWIKNYLVNVTEEVFINFGGSILSHQKNLKVGLRSCKENEENLLIINLKKGLSVHTSAAYEQSSDNKSHIYQKDLIDKYEINLNKSITIVDQNSAKADALATALFAMETNLAIAFCKDNSIDAIIVDHEKIYIKNTLMPLIKINTITKLIHTF